MPYAQYNIRAIACTAHAPPLQVLRGMDIVDARTSLRVLMTLSMTPSQIGLAAPFVLHGLQVGAIHSITEKRYARAHMSRAAHAGTRGVRAHTTAPSQARRKPRTGMIR